MPAIQEVKMLSAATLATMVICLDLGASATMAQFTPFLARRAEPGLSATDLDLMRSSIDRLNRNQSVAVGSEEQWANPATGSHGLSTVVRIFTSGHMPCHAVRHVSFPLGRDKAERLDLTWCRVAEGTWKIKS
jgi:hypothetical protein